MAELVKIEDTVELPQPRAAVWPVLAKTDWINRASGLPPVKYLIEPLPEGGSRVTAQAKIFGQSLAWREFPFEWTEPKFYQVRRVYSSGPLKEAVMGLRFNETPTGCAIEIFGHFVPRNYLGDFLARRVIGPKALRGMRSLIRHVGEHLAGQQAAVLPELPTATANLGVLENGLKKLSAENLPEPLVARLHEFFIAAPDFELSHIRPFALARKWNADRWDVLRLFLHATRAGLLNLSWEVLCPNCRSTRLPRNAELRQLARLAHCDVCNIKFDAEFDKSVELKFSVSPSLRACDEQTFCLVGPGGRPHIASQMVVEPGQSREWDLPAIKNSHRLRSLQVKASAAVWSVQSALTAFDVEIICSPDRFELKIALPKNDTHTVRVTNPNPFPIQIALEEGLWDEDVLTAGRVTNWQEFRDLFAAEVISPTEQVTVGSQIVLFTDLRGSTAIYTDIGDAPAYALVRDHFKILHDAIAANHGGVVKTIGDAVMAVFSDLAEALAAARQMHERLRHLKPNAGARLQLKSALHAGPCLAVNANDKLDFFGSVVNLAARLVERSEGDDLVVTDEIFRRAETQKFLQETRQVGVAGQEQFTGFTAPVKIWRIPMPSARSA